MGEMRHSTWVGMTGKEGTLILQQSTEPATEARASGPARTALWQAARPHRGQKAGPRARRPAGRAGRPEHGSVEHETRSSAESRGRRRFQSSEGSVRPSQRAGRGWRTVRSGSGRGAAALGAARAPPLSAALSLHTLGQVGARAQREEGRSRPEPWFLG